VDWSHFAKDYGGHVIGLLALVQVWAIALWRRLYSRGSLTSHETSSIEIGFSTFGPTVTLLGTLRAEHKDVFVKRMQVRVIRSRDRAEHTFTWRAFRPNVVTLGSGGSQTMEIAGSFLVTITRAHAYNVFFASAVFAGQYEQFVQPLRDSWNTFVEQEIRRVDENMVGQIGRALENPFLSTQLFNSFIAAGHATNLHTAISNDFFWHAGDYELEFTVETNARPELLIQRWRYTLTAQDEQNLRFNAITSIRELCNLPVVYNFVYKEYRTY
jgi:hypothetical protein